MRIILPFQSRGSWNAAKSQQQSLSFNIDPAVRRRRPPAVGCRPLIWLERAVMNVAGAVAGDYDEWAIKSISSRSPPLADRPGLAGHLFLGAAREKVVSHKIVPSHYFSTPKFYSRDELDMQESFSYRRTLLHTLWELFDYNMCMYVPEFVTERVDCTMYQVCCIRWTLRDAGRS